VALPKADPRPSAPGFPALTNGCRWRRNAAFTITAADREVDASFSLPCSRGEGRLIERTPAVRPWSQERVFVPHSCRSRRRPGSAQSGGSSHRGGAAEPALKNGGFESHSNATRYPDAISADQLLSRMAMRPPMTPT
jgi:hypothetical protein